MHGLTKLRHLKNEYYWEFTGKVYMYICTDCPKKHEVFDGYEPGVYIFWRVNE